MGFRMPAFSAAMIRGCSEISFMIVGDRCDDAKLRCDYVGGVQTAAETYFDNVDVAAFFEMKQRHGGNGFEVGRMGIEFIFL